MHVVVHGHICASFPGLFYEPERLLRPPPGPYLRAVVRDLHGDAALAADQDRLFDRSQYRLPLSPDVRCVDAAVLGDDFAQLDYLIRLREAPWRVKKSVRGSVCPCPHRLIDEFLHELHFRRFGGPPLGTEDRGSHGSVPDEGGDVVANSLGLQHREILCKGSPLPCVRGPGPFPPVVLPVIYVGLPDGRPGHAAVADEVRRHALPESAVATREHERSDVGVRVDVHESWADIEVRGVDRPPAVPLVHGPDLRDVLPRQSEVGNIPRIARAVYYPSAEYAQVEFQRLTGRRIEVPVFDRFTCRVTCRKGTVTSRTISSGRNRWTCGASSVPPRRQPSPARRW